MILFYPQVAKIGVKRYRITDTFSDAVLKHLEIMLAAFCFLYVDDLQAVSFGDDLCLQRMAFFFPE